MVKVGVAGGRPLPCLSAAGGGNVNTRHQMGGATRGKEQPGQQHETLNMVNFQRKGTRQQTDARDKIE